MKTSVVDDSPGVYLYGSGGHANVVQDVLERCGQHVIARFDDRTPLTANNSKPEEGRSIDAASPVAATSDQYTSPTLPGVYQTGQHRFNQVRLSLIICVGDNYERFKIAQRIPADYHIAIDPSAIVAASSTIEVGTVVLHGAIIQSNATIGEHCLINTGASIDHDNKLGDFVHISPQAALSGHVTVGEGTHIGVGACVIPSVTIGKWCNIGAGAVVVRDIPDFCTVVGNPARVVKRWPNLSSRVAHYRNGRDAFDLFFIGCGLASSAVLLSLLQSILMAEGELGSRGSKLRIGISDKAGEFFKGVAYGDRSGYSSLIITNLNEFLPEQYLPDFYEWVAKNIDWKEYCSRNKKLARWFDENKADLINANLGELHIPRHVFGDFLAAKVRRTIALLEDRRQIEVEYLSDEVVDLELSRAEIAVETRPSRQLTSKICVLGIGSPPAKQFDLPSENGDLLVIRDPFNPGLVQNLESIKQHFLHLPTDRKPTIAIVGANASALELVYHLVFEPAVATRLGKIVLMSRSETLPDPADTSSASGTIITDRLDQLVAATISGNSRKDLQAVDIYEAAIDDIKANKKNGLGISDSLQTISQGVMHLCDRLNAAELELFVSHYGVEIGRHQRRAGRDYLEAVNSLLQQKKLEHLKGAFESITTIDGEHFIEFTSPGSLDHEKSSLPVDALVFCSGAEELTVESSSILLSNLISRNIGVVNQSKRGFTVDENYQIEKNVFLAGPLLAGNVVGDNRIWHTEHCGRLLAFGKETASKISATLARLES